MGPTCMHGYLISGIETAFNSYMRIRTPTKSYFATVITPLTALFSTLKVLIFEADNGFISSLIKKSGWEEDDCSLDSKPRQASVSFKVM